MMFPVFMRKTHYYVLVQGRLEPMTSGMRGKPQSYLIQRIATEWSEAGDTYTRLCYVYICITQ